MFKVYKQIILVALLCLVGIASSMQKSFEADDKQYIGRLLREAKLWQQCTELQSLIKPYTNEEFFANFARMNQFAAQRSLTVDTGGQFYDMCLDMALLEYSSDEHLGALLQIYNVSRQTHHNIEKMISIFKKYENEAFGQIGLKLCNIQKSIKLSNTIAVSLKKHHRPSPFEFSKYEKDLGFDFSMYLINPSAATFATFSKRLSQYKPEVKNAQFTKIAKQLGSQKQLFTEESLKQCSPAAKTFEQLSKADFLPPMHKKQKQLTLPVKQQQKKSGKNTRRRRKNIVKQPIEVTAPAASEEIGEQDIVIANVLGSKQVMSVHNNYVKIADQFGNMHTIYNITKSAAHSSAEQLLENDAHGSGVTFHKRVIRWYQQDVSEALKHYRIRNAQEADWVTLLHRCPLHLPSTLAGMGLTNFYTDKAGRQIEVLTHYGKVETAEGNTFFVKYEAGYMPGEIDGRKVCYHFAMRKCDLKDLMSNDGVDEELLRNYYELSLEDHFPALS